MSYPGYPGQGYGSGAPTYPPYPNAPPPQHATASLSYPTVGFAPQQHPSYPSFPGASGGPSHQPPYPPTQQPYPPSPYPPAQGSVPYPPHQPYPPTQGSSTYPPKPYPPTQGSSPYPPQPYPPTQGSSPYPPQPYPPAQGSSPYSPTPPSHGSSPYSPTPPSHGSSPYPANPSPSFGSHPTNPHHPFMPTTTPPYGGQFPQSSGPISKGNPTVHPAPNFDPRSDAEILRKAMKGFGTDEKAIINVLAHRSNAQRQQIALQFKTLYGKDLVSNLKSELTGKFEDLIVRMMMPITEFLAKEVHDAIAGIGTDEDVLVEVICTATNQEIHAIKASYQNLYGRSMEEDLRGDTSGTFKRLMVSLCVGNRSENYNVDHATAQADAQALLRAGELRVGTDESTFNAILCQRSYPQLQAVMVEYQRITGHSLEKAIRNEFSGDIEEGLVAVLKCAENRPAFFADRLYKSMKGMGTDDRALIRLVVSRCEIDMGDIKNAFVSKYGQTLESFISGDCSGDYKKCLLALVGA